MLKYLKNIEIDKLKWNACISTCKHGLIYAEFEYLNTMSEHWDALVMNDYEAVMPLTWKSKYGIKYLYQPAFIQQGGIFSIAPISIDTINVFIDTASSHFKFAEIALHHAMPDDIKSFSVVLKNNYLLSLESNYESLSGNYKPYIKERLQRLKKFKLEYKSTEDINKAVDIYRSTYGYRLSKVSVGHFEQFKSLCAFYALEKRVIVREVTDEVSKESLAIVVMLKDNNRIYNLASSVTAKGKKLLANYFLYDQIFREFSGKGLIFDFEGSDIPGVAYFYEKFADCNQQYPFLKWNKLPLLIRLLKR